MLGLDLIERYRLPDGDGSRPGDGWPVGKGGDALRQIDETQLRAVREDYGPLHGVAKLTQVAGPMISRQGVPCSVGQALDSLPHTSGEEREEMLGQAQAVGPLPKRRESQLDDVEPELQILAELAGGDGGIQVPIRRRDQADVGRP